MKSNKSSGSIIGMIILDIIVFADVAVDVYTGELNCTDFVRIITLTLFLAIPFIIIVRRIRKK